MSPHEGRSKTAPRSKTLVGVLEIDGKQQRIEAARFSQQVSDADQSARGAGARDPHIWGTQVTESFQMDGDVLVTSVTVATNDCTTTTTTTSDDDSTTTTTATTDSAGNTTTTIKIDRK